ncbi:MAG: hypothetical protein M3256_10525 [Actinomycetota bacterium]|nr:hypothetical protein [Actinomycetota bacterium]
MSGAGDYISTPFAPVGPGTYRFVAAYSGDASNARASTACGDTNESFEILSPTPVVILTDVSSGPASLRVTAILSGGSNVTGFATLNAVRSQRRHLHVHHHHHRESGRSGETGCRLDVLVRRSHHRRHRRAPGSGPRC